MKKRLFIATVFSIMMLAAYTYADSMRCQGRIIKTGDTTTQVRLTCGDPFSVEVFGSNTVVKRKTENKKEVTTKKEVVKEKWTYNLGRGRLLKILTFHDGVLVTIESGLRMK